MQLIGIQNLCFWGLHLSFGKLYFLSVKRQDGVRSDRQKNDQTIFCDENKSWVFWYWNPWVDWPTSYFIIFIIAKRLQRGDVFSFFYLKSFFSIPQSQCVLLYIPRWALRLFILFCDYWSCKLLTLAGGRWREEIQKPARGSFKLLTLHLEVLTIYFVHCPLECWGAKQRETTYLLSSLEQSTRGQVRPNMAFQQICYKCLSTRFFNKELLLCSVSQHIVCTRFDLGVDRRLRERKRLFNTKHWATLNEFISDTSDEPFRYFLPEITKSSLQPDQWPASWFLKSLV